MIPNDAIIAWRRTVPWRTAAQVEQDLLLSQLIIEIANDALLGAELIFRGGTCFHKLYLPSPLRYSEDLDYVRQTNSPIGPIFDALRAIGERVGMKVNTEVTRHPKVYLRAPFEDGTGRMRIKIEMNTHETTSALSPVRVPFELRSPWFTGRAEVLTFELAELVATKIRALFQRRKGRDLFDLWLALDHLNLDPDRIIDAFANYRPDGFSAERAVETLTAHLANPVFRGDAASLSVTLPFDYDVDAAAALVTDRLLSRIR